MSTTIKLASTDEGMDLSRAADAMPKGNPTASHRGTSGHFCTQAYVLERAIRLLMLARLELPLLRVLRVRWDANDDWAKKNQHKV